LCQLAREVTDESTLLRYLQVTQEADGHWSQNMWLEGTPYWRGIQMDGTALPILLVDLAYRNGILDVRQRDAFWPMVRRAAAFLVRNGPVSPQDRWEEKPGYARFTVATKVAALVVAAELAGAVGEETPRRIYSRQPMPGTRASNGGCLSHEPNWRISMASRATTFV
jgi:GH15 family glucan-1,4-alpha-glucosidase